MSRITSLRRSFLINLLVMVSAVFLLQACGGGGHGGAGATPPPAITASPGYFDNVTLAGGADVFSDAGNTISLHIADLQGMVHGNQFTLVSVANNLAYFATLTSLSGNNYTADVVIYQNNVPIENTTLSGTLVAGISIAGTFATSGTAYGHGTFSLKYSSANTPVIDVSRIVKGWVNNTPGPPYVSLSSFQIDSAGVLQNTIAAGVGIFTSCNISGNVAPIPSTALYQVSMTLSSCTTLAMNGSYSGLATSRTQTTTDDRLVVTVTSGTSSMNGEFH